MTTNRLRHRMLVGAVLGSALGVAVAVPATLAVDRADPVDAAPAAPDLRSLLTCSPGSVEVVTIDPTAALHDTRTPDEAIDDVLPYVGHPDLKTIARRQTVYSTASARTITIRPESLNDGAVAAFTFEAVPSGQMTLSSWAMCWGFEP